MTPLARTLDTNTRTLLQLVPAVRDGSVEAVHDARVATRRLRAAMSIPNESAGSAVADEARGLLKRVARALGRVRDLDISLELLGELERRVPSAGPAAAFVRQALQQDRTRARRRMVKKLDDLPLHQLPALVRRWKPRLGRALAVKTHERAISVIRAVEHATGVYFPRRAHAARIEIKNLRYLVELYDPSDVEALKILKRCQETLGAIQDHQVVRASVTRIQEASVDSAVDLDPLVAMLDAECVVLYDRFVEHRTELRQTCERLASVSAERRAAWAKAFMIVGAVAAGSLIELRRPRRPAVPAADGRHPTRMAGHRSVGGELRRSPVPGRLLG